MEKFLKQIELSENSIILYLKALKKTPLTYYELYTLVPTLNQEEFDLVLNELMNKELMIQIQSDLSELLTFYHIIPPIQPILNYYTNINTNFNGIERQIISLVEENIEENFQQENKVELDSLLENYQEIRKDVEEDGLLQKQDIEDIVEAMDSIKVVNDLMQQLRKNIDG
ncbi:MAG: hypothetical protein EU548_07625, partial [Promethearchaeota archaeon]